MITGTVNADYEAVIRLFVQGPAGPAHEVDAIIDTGFNGFLTLPPALVTTLGHDYASVKDLRASRAISVLIHDTWTSRRGML